MPRAILPIGNFCLVLKRHSHPQQLYAVMRNTSTIASRNNEYKSSFRDDKSTNFLRRTERLFWVPCKAAASLMGRKRIKRLYKYLGTEYKTGVYCLFIYSHVSY
jgi:hypothetical protein